MGKRKERVPTPSELESALLYHYCRWKDIYDNGCSDPSWEDGVNLGLKRNHILIEKRRCEAVLQDNYLLYPDCYYFPIPVVLPSSFMAADRSITRKGGVLLSTKTMPYEEAVQFDWNNVFEGGPFLEF